MESEPYQSIIFLNTSKHFSMLSEQLACMALSPSPEISVETVDKYFLPKATVSFFIGLTFSLLVLEVYYERTLADKRRG